METSPKIIVKNSLTSFLMQMFKILLPLIILALLLFLIGADILSLDIRLAYFNYSYGSPPILFLVLMALLLFSFAKYRTNFFDELKRVAPIGSTNYLITIFAIIFMYPKGITHHQMLTVNLSAFFNITMVLAIIHILSHFSNRQVSRQRFLTMGIDWKIYYLALPFWYLIASCIHIIIGPILGIE
jgi:hypothetical protein